MILLKEVIQADLCTLFNTITGEVFIQGNPQPVGEVNTPSPTGLYGMVNILNMTETGITDFREYENQVGPEVDLLEKISGGRRIQVSINTYRQGAFNLISFLYTALQRNATLEYLTARSLGYGNRSDIRDLSTLSGPGLEERYQMDLFLFTVASDQDIVYAIQSLTITAIADNGTQQFTYDIEVNAL